MVQGWISGDRFLSPEMVCELVPGLTKVILEDLRKRRRGPPFHKPTGRTVIYRESAIIEWVLSTRVDTRSG
jgi:hypothetical protein